jgi:amino acid adenylation domain-containing protein
MVFRTVASVPDAFAQAARAVPGNVAVKDADRALTYAELHELSGRVAAGLAAAGVAPGDRVGVGLARTWRLPAVLAGVLRAGCCYVPLDPGCPAARRASIAADAGLATTITDDGNGLAAESLLAATGTPARDGPGRRDLACILYTSGPAGAPTGVPITHGNLLALFGATCGLFGFTSQDRWALVHPCSSGLSAWELWGALLHGGCAMMVPARVAGDGEHFWDLLAREQVTVLTQAPSAPARLPAAAGPTVTPPLRWLILCGEPLDRPLAAAFLRGHPGTAVASMHGTIETTVHATFKRLALPDLASAQPRSPIGAPLPHLRIDLRDEWGDPVPHGETGEIYICGPSVARGYWRRPGVTAERFIPDSSIVNGERRARHWFRTGDLARRLPSGEYDYHGRCEDLLKVDGLRIDPGEVEDAFRRCPHVRAVAATAEPAPVGGFMLVLYYVSAPDAPPGLPEVLRCLARDVLPWHMRPTRFTALPRLPLTPTGKPDRRALARITGSP